MRKILIVEDDTLLNRTLGYNLASDGYEITAAYNHKDAVFHLKETEFDVALLDINLPDGSGLDLCEEIRGRGQHTYIIFITANDKESDMLKGYEAGGADYVTKPFSVTVLCRKVAAVFANLELRTPRHDLFDDGFLKIDFSEQRASLAGEPLDFTPKEYRTLFLFVKNPRIILTKRQILEKLWDIDGDFVDEHTLTTIISRIRKKIETDEHMLKRNGGEIKIMGLDNVADEQKAKAELGVVFDTNYFSDDWQVTQVEKSISVFYPNWKSERFAEMLRKFHIAPTKKVKEPLKKGQDKPTEKQKTKQDKKEKQEQADKPKQSRGRKR